MTKNIDRHPYPPHHQWTEEERDVIRRDYQHTHESARLIANRLGVTAFAVRGQVANMGIAKSDDRHPWSDAEDGKLRELIPQFCPRRVAHMMNRSLNSVVVRAKRLGLHRRDHVGWFTKQEVCQIIGHGHKWVQARIDAGQLVASWHHEVRPPGVGSACWHIDERDLVRFIRRYPQELVGCNIDIITIVDLLAGIENNHK